MRNTYTSYYKAANDILAETTALLARMTIQPNEARKNLINNTIKALKDEGIWSKLDVFYLMAAHDNQAATLNWVKNAHNLTPVNSPTFTTDIGFTVNSGISLNSNYTISTQAVNYTVSNASAGLYSRTDAVGGSDLSQTAGTARVIIMKKYTGNLLRCCINTPTTTLFTASVSSGAGLSCVETADNKRKLFKNGSKLLDEAHTPTGLASVSTTFQNTVASELNFAYLGAALGDTLQQKLKDIINNYLTAVGAI